MKFIFPLFFAVIFSGCAIHHEIKNSPYTPQKVLFLEAKPDCAIAKGEIYFWRDFDFIKDRIEIFQEIERRTLKKGANTYVANPTLRQGDHLIFSGNIYFCDPGEFTREIPEFRKKHPFNPNQNHFDGYSNWLENNRPTPK